ncbi:MAG: neutral/alkaline non-lysosomal ceramidase N-terminal domain-containing protein, partial [Myxococcota bacterium]|nr:neutral/alkaline non-lysosomal ceramidase N-terminal domain-containing protein [Myxococcota bacterium]
MRSVARIALGLSLAACGDGGPRDRSEVRPDSGEALPPPGALEAGFARVRIPAAVGMGTVGYGPDGGIESESPYSVIYPGTRHVHGHPELKAAVISRGDAHEIVFVRFDTVGVFQQFRRAVVLEYRERTGRDIDDSLVLGATHTHAGPGRIIDGGAIFDIIADRFFPDFYERFVDATVDVIEAAYADLQPARLATTMAHCTEAHADRRCEDGAPDHTNGDIPLIVVERGGDVSMVIGAYAVHGTVLNLSDLTLSQDAHGPIEHAIEDRFDHPVNAIMFNSWGGDMSPADPDVEGREGADQGDFDQMERIGVTVADQVHATLSAGLAWDAAPEVQARVYRP